jgi:hypothetical protein
MKRGVRSRQLRLPEAVGPDTPLRLKIAAALAYPDGAMTDSGLRREASRGRLVIEHTAGKDYTTLAAIQRMRELCRVEPKAPDCGSGVRSVTPMGNLPTVQSGLSKTANTEKALDAAKKIVEALKARSPNTSHTSTSLASRPAYVRRLRSPLRMS